MNNNILVFSVILELKKNNFSSKKGKKKSGKMPLLIIIYFPFSIKKPVV